MHALATFPIQSHFKNRPGASSLVNKYLSPLCTPKCQHFCTIIHIVSSHCIFLHTFHTTFSVAVASCLSLPPLWSMATGGYRAPPATSNTTDFLEEWKAKREKMRARLYGEVPGSVLPATGAGTGSSESVIKTSVAIVNNELNNNSTSSHQSALPDRPNCISVTKSSSSSALRKPDEDQSPPLAAPSTGGRVAPEPTLRKGQEKLPPAAQQPQDQALEGTGAAEDAKTKEKAKSSGPSARKGKGQIEKRKMREKRRSTGVVNIPSLESPDEYEDDDAGQKERKKADAVTQQNTAQNESLIVDPSDSYLQQETSRTVSNRFKSATNAADDEATSRYSRTAYNRHNKDSNLPGNSTQNSVMEKKIEELERELAKERQENARLANLIQDKEDIIEKMKEEIDLLNRDLDDIEDENEQLKQENKTLLKVVGQLTR